MNYAKYYEVRRQVLHGASDAMEDAAKRNEYKDERQGPPMLGWPSTYVVGWRGCDLKPKLMEEVDEVLRKPSRDELGDVMWVCAMILDQLNRKEESVTVGAADEA